MTEKEKSIYMAGFFDGEGYVGIVKRKRSDVYTEYIVQASIGQNDGAIMDWLHENFGGHIHLVKRDNSYTWIVTNQVALKILKRMVPYLKYKKPQVELALSFYAITSPTKRISPAELARREDIYLKLKEEKKVFTKSTHYIVRVQRLNESTPIGDVTV